MAKYIDLPNLKENLTNFLNKKINPIYAKKTEIPSNVSELNNDKSYQTAEEVGQAVTDGVARIVAGAPEDFDTLKEMSDWISSHETSAAAMNSAISDNSVAIANHTSNSDIHVTKEEKTKWNKLDSNLKDGTIIVAEATKATQDAQGNVINETYAKKTEVPQGTVVDDALSSTSTNPVQNKVVKAEFDQVNSNLGCLEFNGWTIPNDMPLKDASLVDKVDMGSLTWNYISSGQFFYADLAGGKIGSKNAYCSRYNLSNSSSYGGMANKEFMLSVSSENVSRVFLKDTTYTDETVLKNSLNGQYLYFERVTAKTFTDGQNVIDQLNSNLDDLEYSDVAGGKNLFNPKCLLNATYDEKTDTITISSNTDKALDMVFKENTQYTFSAYIKQSSSSTNIRFRVIYTDGTSNEIFLFTRSTSEVYTSETSQSGKTISEVRWYWGEVGTATFRNLQIEEGTTATPYEPYIPSVKMLAEENAQQNNSLTSLGKCKNLLKPTLQTTTQNGVTCTNNGDGTYTLNGTKTIDGVMWFMLGNISLKANTSYKLIAQSSTYTTTDVRVYDNDGMYFGDGTYKGATPIIIPTEDIILNMQIRIGENTPINNFIVKPMLTTNLSATYDDFVPYTGEGDTLTADVASLKNDLSNLKDGTTSVAKAVADEDGNNIKSTYATKAKAFIDYSHKSVDLDTLTTAPSLISIGYDVTNKPSKFYGGYMFVVNAGYSASIALYQILFDVLYNKTYQRKYYHGSWTAWSYVTTPQDIETITLTTTSGTATLYKLGKMRHLVLNDATFSSTTRVLNSTDAPVGSLYFRAEVLFNSGDDLEGGSATLEDICISGSSMWNATRTATGASPVAVKGATGSVTWMVQ